MTRDVTVEVDPFRLPRQAAPTTYRVELEPDLDAATFAGRVQIELDVAERCEQLVLNSIELDITSCAVDGIAASGWELDETTERLFVTPAAPLEAGTSATLTIAFTGILNDKLRGWYRSTYTDTDGNEQVIATTQMQATDCRRAFPCWDEPDFKATFEITLVVDPHLLAVSNGREVSRTERDGKVAVQFAETMPMSTYLVAFVVGPLEVTAPIDVDGIPLRIVHVPGKSNLTAFGLEIGAFALRWYQDYYDIAYPSDKIDLLALPDFAAGAMENLGCITFRESLLLVDPDTATQSELQLVVDVVTHELAHMWFGDLVTMHWWNGIWLNEAFATFMEVACCDAFRPHWHRWTSFGLERSVAFETDSLASTRPVEYEVHSPADCEGMFDVLTYQKGGALLRMLEQYLGPDTFRRGVSHYLKRHAYDNTETNDLWDAIEETSGEPVRRIMDSWIWQPGYPLVSAGVDGHELVLRQQRFSFSDSDPGDSDGAARWAIPVQVRVGDGAAATTERLLLDGDETRLALPGGNPLVVVNAGGHGFYRVAYDDALRARLAGDALATLARLERYSLVDDAWSAVVAGRLSATDFLTFIDGFAADRDLAVWQVIAIGLRGLGRLVDDETRPALQRRITALAAPALADLGDPTEGEDDLRAKLRGLLLGLTAVNGADTATIERARRLFDRNEQSPGTVDPELVAAATTVVAATGDASDYDRLLDGFRTASTPQDQLRYLYALAEPDDAELLQRTCELAMSGEVKTQNAPFLLRMCIGNRRHGELAWRFLREHWDEANETFPSNTIVRMVDSVKLLTRPEIVDEVQAFFAEHPVTQAAKTLDQILERQRVNAALRQREAQRFGTSL